MLYTVYAPMEYAAAPDLRSNVRQSFEGTEGGGGLSGGGQAAWLTQPTNTKYLYLLHTDYGQGVQEVQIQPKALGQRT